MPPPTVPAAPIPQPIDFSRALGGVEVTRAAHESLRDNGLPEVGGINADGTHGPRHIVTGTNRNFVLVDRESHSVLGNTALLREICAVEAACVVPTDALKRNVSATGMYFAHNERELSEVLAVPGAEVITFEDRLTGHVRGAFVYHTDGDAVAKEDRELFTKGRALLAKEGIHLEPHERIGVAHEVCINADVNIASADQPAWTRLEVYEQMDAWVRAESASRGVTVQLATCRIHPAPNPALHRAHEALGWRVLGGPDDVLKFHVRLPSGEEITIVEAIIVRFIDPRDAYNVGGGDIPFRYVTSDGHQRVPLHVLLPADRENS